MTPPAEASSAVSLPEVTLRIGTPRREAFSNLWGDTILARALVAYAERVGTRWRIAFSDDPLASGEGVIVDMLGLVKEPAWRHGRAIAWLISHPELHDEATLAGYDAVLTSSRWLAQGRGGRWRLLPEPTDVGYFEELVAAPVRWPSDIEERVKNSVVFVGSSRGAPRPLVMAAARSGLDFLVFGGGWEQLRSRPSVTLLGSASRREAHWLYQRARLAVNDHWPAMLLNGFLSKRVVDVLAAGGNLVTDVPRGMDQRLRDSVWVASDPESVVAAWASAGRAVGSGVERRMELPPEYSVPFAFAEITQAAREAIHPSQRRRVTRRMLAPDTHSLSERPVSPG